MDNNQNNENYYSQNPQQDPQSNPQPEPQSNPQPGQTPTQRPLQPRSLVTCILLSIVTCGIYTYFWLYSLNEDVRAMTYDASAMSGGMVILLSIVTCGIFLYYWMYKQGQAIDLLKTQKGISSSNTGLIYLVLTFFGLGIVAYALMQSEVNNLIQG